eukprot:m51a1_g9267 hypothetical protein (774) ;mRNA; r:76070-78900
MLWLWLSLWALGPPGVGAAGSQWSYGYAFELTYGSHLSWPTLLVDWSSEHTVSAWVNTYSVALAAAGLVGPAGVDVGAGLVLQFGGRLALLAGADAEWASGHMVAQIDPFRWYHVVATFDPHERNGTARLYVDGSVSGQWSGIGASGAGRSPLVVGRKRSAECDDSWSGLVDDVAVWARALAPREVDALYGGAGADAGPLSAGLLVYARADSDEVDLIVDSGPGGNHGVPVSGETLYGSYKAPVSYRADCIVAPGQRTCSPLSLASVRGDGAVTGVEECDGGPHCTPECACEAGFSRDEWGCDSAGVWCSSQFSRAGDEMARKFLSVECFRVNCVTLTIRNYLASHCSLNDIGGMWAGNWLAICMERVRKFTYVPTEYPDWYCYALIVKQSYRKQTDRKGCEDSGFFWCLDHCVSGPIDCKPVCGNAVLDKALDEVCDFGTEGSLTVGGCAPGCGAANVGYTCDEGGSLCNSSCGDGVKANSEQCDDGNVLSGDGCDSQCLLENAALYPEPSSVAKGYSLITAGQEDMQRVLREYGRHPVPGMTVASVEIVHSPTLEVLFATRVEQLQRRSGDLSYAPAWLHEGNVVQRASVIERLTALAEPHGDPEFPAVGLLPLWHGTSPALLDSICQTGFANLATTDVGYFGKGLYTSVEAIYAHDAYAAHTPGGVLLLCWVSFFSAYPVLAKDMAKLTGKGRLGNHDAHFVPVVPEGPGDVRKQTVFFPCSDVRDAVYHEMVVFEASQMLPRYIVRLHPVAASDNDNNSGGAAVAIQSP